MRKFKILACVFSVFALLLGCDDILEEDITNDTIAVISPSPGMAIVGNTVQFSWNNLDGAESYRIQIINDQQINTLDSLVTSNVFAYVLNSGSYQWRIRGENFAYNTAYTFPVNFSVETSNDLSTQLVVLQTPSSNFYTNSPNILFTWTGLESATSYTLELLRNLNGLETIDQEADIQATNYTIDGSLLDEDAEYIWRVKASNTTSETGFTERSLFLDRVTPNQPSLVSPTDMETTTTTVNFNWTNGVDTGNVQSDITNTIEIGNDIDFNSIVTTNTTSNNSFQFVFDDSGTYYWRVKANDAASNESDYSAVRSLTIL